jgi:hypothetical protein
MDVKCVMCITLNTVQFRVLENRSIVDRKISLPDSALKLYIGQVNKDSISLQKTGNCRIMCEVRVLSTVLPVRERKTKSSVKHHNC